MLELRLKVVNRQIRRDLAGAGWLDGVAQAAVVPVDASIFREGQAEMRACRNVEKNPTPPEERTTR